MEQKQDQDILNMLKANSNSEKAFRMILSRYQEKMYWHIRRIVIDHDDANDVCQNVFIKVWRKLDTFRAESSLYSWIYRIATNESLNFLRKYKKYSTISMDEESNFLQEKLASSDWLSGDEILVKLQAAILKLPEKQRLVFNMKYFDKLTYNDISEILETSVGGLKANYHHAVQKIELFLKQD